mgnify:CR=1 FL=1
MRYIFYGRILYQFSCYSLLSWITGVTFWTLEKIEIVKKIITPTVKYLIKPQLLSFATKLQFLEAKFLSLYDEILRPVLVIRAHVNQRVE